MSNPFTQKHNKNTAQGFLRGMAKSLTGKGQLDTMKCATMATYKEPHNINPNPLGCVQNRIQIGGFGTVRVTNVHSKVPCLFFLTVPWMAIGFMIKEY